MIAIVTAVCISDPAWSQGEQLPELRIEVVAADGGRLPKYIAKLEFLHNRQKFRSAELLPDDTWRFRDVPYGEYKLSIAEGTGDPVYEQAITVGAQTPAIMVRLPGRESSGPLSGSVSLLQLRNPIRKKALQSFGASQRFLDAGEYGKAVYELEKAIQISPGYAQAYSTLGVVHIRMGLYGQAVGEITRAIDIAGPNAQDLSSLALAEYNLGRYADSMQSAWAALRLDPNYDPAHYVLGAVLALDRRTMAEAMSHLERAAQTIGSAKAILMVVKRELSRE